MYGSQHFVAYTLLHTGHFVCVLCEQKMHKCTTDTSFSLSESSILHNVIDTSIANHNRHTLLLLLLLLLLVELSIKFTAIYVNIKQNLTECC